MCLDFSRTICFKGERRGSGVRVRGDEAGAQGGAATHTAGAAGGGEAGDPFVVGVTGGADRRGGRRGRRWPFCYRCQKN